MLSDHEHIIDCIVWAHLEAAKTIENSMYNQGTIHGSTGDDANNDESADTEDIKKGEGEDNDGGVGSAAAGEGGGEDTRQTVHSRISTKERI